MSRTAGYPIPCTFCNDVAAEDRTPFDDLVSMGIIELIQGSGGFIRVEMKRHFDPCPSKE